MVHLKVTSPEDYQRRFYEHIGLVRVLHPNGEAWENPDVGFVHSFGDMGSIQCSIGSYTIPRGLTIQYDYRFSYLRFGIIIAG